jgi:CBS domain-containing protein
MPVLENGVLVGILSTYDILWWMYNNKKEIHPKDFGVAGNDTSF